MLSFESHLWKIQHRPGMWWFLRFRSRQKPQRPDLLPSHQPRRKCHCRSSQRDRNCQPRAQCIQNSQRHHRFHCHSHHSSNLRCNRDLSLGKCNCHHSPSQSHHNCMPHCLCNQGCKTAQRSHNCCRIHRRWFQDCRHHKGRQGIHK